MIKQWINNKEKEEKTRKHELITEFTKWLRLSVPLQRSDRSLIMLQKKRLHGL